MLGKSGPLQWLLHLVMLLCLFCLEFDLGRLQNVTEQVDDVVLPPWAKSPYDFVHQHMQALVCITLATAVTVD